MSWWRHQMETFSALLALCAGNSPVPVKSPHKGQWRGALMFSLICARINDWVNNHEAGDLRRHHGHYDVNVMVPYTKSKYIFNASTFNLVALNQSDGLLSVVARTSIFKMVVNVRYIYLTETECVSKRGHDWWGLVAVEYMVCMRLCLFIRVIISKTVWIISDHTWGPWQGLLMRFDVNKPGMAKCD